MSEIKVGDKVRVYGNPLAIDYIWEDVNVNGICGIVSGIYEDWDGNRFKNVLEVNLFSENELTYRFHRKQCRKLVSIRYAD